jgi:DNA-binding transcriptional ArsR family regulator
MQSLVVLKALSDESRLGIFRLLLERDAYSEVIAERLKLAPSTVSFHLKKLMEAGLITSVRDQYYTIYSAVPKVADMSLKSLVLGADVKLAEQDEVEEKYKDKALKSFFKYGKLVKIPSQKMKREWVLQRVAESFQAAKAYSSLEAEDILSEIFEDSGLLLKELKAGGYLKLVEGKFRRPSSTKS